MKNKVHKELVQSNINTAEAFNQAKRDAVNNGLYKVSGVELTPQQYRRLSLQGYRVHKVTDNTYDVAWDYPLGEL
jgi:hypothetical protein